MTRREKKDTSDPTSGTNIPCVPPPALLFAEPRRERDEEADSGSAIFRRSEFQQRGISGIRTEE
jgi:hypothetical protein